MERMRQKGVIKNTMLQLRLHAMMRQTGVIKTTMLQLRLHAMRRQKGVIKNTMLQQTSMTRSRRVRNNSGRMKKRSCPFSRAFG